MENTSEVQRRESSKLPFTKLPRHRSQGRPIPPTRMMRQLWRKIVQSITTNCIQVCRKCFTNVLPGNSWIAVLNTPTTCTYYLQTRQIMGLKWFSRSVLCTDQCHVKLPYLVITILVNHSSPGLPQIHSIGIPVQDSVIYFSLGNLTPECACM